MGEKTEMTNKQWNDSVIIKTEDPNAVEKLQTEIDEAEKRLTRMKAINKFIATKNEDYLTAVGLTPDEAIKELSKSLYAREGVYPTYAISNLSANIRRIRKRIESVKAKQAILSKSQTIGDIVIEQNPSEMRTQIKFPGKPSAKTITLLKNEGFKWSPLQGKWQRLIGTYSWNLAVEIATKTNAE